MKRKEFLQLGSMGLGALMVPGYLSARAHHLHREHLFESGDTKAKKALADIALEAARSKGATYTDVRIARYLQQSVNTRESRVQNISNSESYGIGIRVIVNGTWGFAATGSVNREDIIRCAETAVAIAKANSRLQKEPVQLARQRSHGEVSWKTPIEKNPFDIPVTEKAGLLLEVNGEALSAGADYISSGLSFVHEQKYYASSEGSYIDQDLHRMWPVFTVTVIDKQSGKFKTRDAFSSPIAMGYEYLTPKETEKLKGPGDVILYRYAYDMIEDVRQATRQTKEKHSASSVTPGRYDLVLDPNHLGLTIHESIGHSTELDRVLGYEANYAGTSFATLDKWKSGNFEFGSKIVNVFGDRTQPNFLNTIGYDDDGVEAKEWDILKDGILVSYQATRDQTHILGLTESQGCSHADSWENVQFQRMPNVSLKPGTEKCSVHDMVKDVEKGIYILGRGSYSIDHQRYNFQFGGQLYYAIEKGEITGMLEDVAYQSNTRDFWNSCVQICDKDDYRPFGTFRDGKGQPGQISAVSHGSSTTRFNNITVLNTNTQNNA